MLCLHSKVTKSHFNPPKNCNHHTILTLRPDTQTSPHKDKTTSSHTLSSASLLTSEPGTLAQSHARQTYGCMGKHKAPFHTGGVGTEHNNPTPTHRHNPSRPQLLDNMLPCGCLPSQEAFEAVALQCCQGRIRGCQDV